MKFKTIIIVATMLFNTSLMASSIPSMTSEEQLEAEAYQIFTQV